MACRSAADLNPVRSVEPETTASDVPMERDAMSCMERDVVTFSHDVRMICSVMGDVCVALG